MPGDQPCALEDERPAHRSRYGEPQDEDSRRVAWLVVIVAGTAIGGLIAYFAARWYETRQVEIALQQFQRTVAATSVQAQRDAAAFTERMLANQAAERERAAAEAARQEATKRRAAELDALRIAAIKLEADRQEAAWLRYYRPSDACRDPDNRASMTCVNEHARAKREFQSKWARGELRP
jgi:hypothetical protein